MCHGGLNQRSPARSGKVKPNLRLAQGNALGNIVSINAP